MRSANDKSYFSFTRKERNGILLLTGIALLTVSISIVYPYIFTTPPEPASEYADEMGLLKAREKDTAQKYSSSKKNYKSYKTSSYNDDDIGGEFFHFDPNTISSDQWKRLGLHDKTIAIIQNYLTKGGRFREPDDLRKIWSLNKKLADRIIPYARIEKQTDKGFSYTLPDKKTYTSKTYEVVHVNQSDTSALAALPGIGPRLSQRIIKYRDRLGGFYSVDQVGETFGLPDSTFKKIKAWLQIDKENIKTININTATIDELKTHPYIRYNLANALFQYRQQHKSYTSISEIKNIMLVDDTTYKKLAPYLVVE